MLLPIPLPVNLSEYRITSYSIFSLSIYVTNSARHSIVPEINNDRQLTASTSKLFDECKIEKYKCSECGKALGHASELDVPSPHYKISHTGEPSNTYLISPHGEFIARSPMTKRTRTQHHPEPSYVRSPFPITSDRCLDGHVTNRSDFPVAGGGTSDIWKGYVGTRMVAIKIIRPFSSTGAQIQRTKLLKRLWREYLTWSCISHPNILDCRGFTYDFTPEGDLPALISSWMSNGDVNSYINAYPDVDRFKLVLGIAEGVCHLHNWDPVIVHGDIRAGNILISEAGDPCLTDFGISKILDDTWGLTTSSEPAGSLRWMSPELLSGDKLSASSDVWAYGMTVVEIFSGARPYDQLSEPMVFGRIIKGVMPSRPATFTDELWATCQRCWRLQPEHRSSMYQVKLELRDLLFSYNDLGKHAHNQPTSPDSPVRASPYPSPSPTPSPTSSPKVGSTPLLDVGASIGYEHGGMTPSLPVGSLPRPSPCMDTSDASASLGLSSRTSPYPSPRTSPRTTTNALPDENTFDAHWLPVEDGGECADAGMSGMALDTTDTPRTPVPTKATRDTVARQKIDARFVCPIPGCGSTFTRSFNLKGHLRWHGEERPFKCKWPGCEKAFVRRHECKRHEALHLHARQYTCSACGKAFIRVDTLNRHRLTECGGHLGPAQPHTNGNTYLDTNEEPFLMFE